MRPLSATDIVHVWERSQHRDAVWRAIAMLAPAVPELSTEELASLPVGVRDSWLLAVREQTFGSEMPAYAECPACSERLAFTLSGSSIRSEPDPALLNQPMEFTVDGITVRFRLVSTSDVAAAAALGDVEAARRTLIEACVLQATCDGKRVEPERLPESVAARLADELSRRDPQAEVLLDLTCPACSHRWQLLFDIVLYLWTEITALARRLMMEVHVLAGAYGWRESDILTMSAARRGFYLDLAG